MKLKASPVRRTPRTATVAVIGNPNAGKTTVFNRLTGLSQKVGNYPGVTVEKKEGYSLLDGKEVRFLDLPGTYSLAALSPDEMVAVDVILGQQKGEERPDLVLVVVDASNLERNLYLFSQVMELGVPAVLALNMMDLAAARGIHIDVPALSRELGVPVVPAQAHRGVGLEDLRRAIRAQLDLRQGWRREDGAAGEFGNGEGEGSEKYGMRNAEYRMQGNREGEPPAELPRLALGFGDALDARIADLHDQFAPEFKKARGRDLHSFEVLRAVIDRGGHAENRLRAALGVASVGRLEEARKAVSGYLPLPALEAKVRYGWVRERLRGCVRREKPTGAFWSERIDRILTHKVLGLAIFAGVMLLIFQSIFVWAEPLMQAIESVFGSLGRMVAAALPGEGAMESLLVDGVIAGAGMVVVFLPQILILFFFIGLLEDCGYMARAAFLMDKFMSKCGLSGKSFIPMLSGFACAVPGIMATRVIENRRDRIVTILVTPLMSCSARLPVYSIFIGTFIPDRTLIPGVLGLQAFTLFALYILGMAVAVVMAWVLKKTLLRGPKSPFVLELPSYKLPALSTVLFRLHDRAWAFLLRAGTIILAMAVVVWALSYFPRPRAIGERFASERVELEARFLPGPDREAALEAITREEAGEYLRQSYFGCLGRAVEPCFKPLGWDWRISMAAIAAFPAREVLVSTLGTIFNLGSEVDAKSQALRESLRSATLPAAAGLDARPLFSVPVALSVLVFFALCCQCGATVATIRRETNSWCWAFFAFTYMTVLAYVGALVTYQVGIA